MRYDKFKKKTTHFIETGSHVGNGIQLALDSGFEFIYSIELAQHYYDFCKNKFNNNDKVNMILGDSFYKLKELLDSYPNTPFTYWLDGHYSGDDTGYGVCETPIMTELECILSRNVDNELIYVDDMRLYRNMNDSVNVEKIKELIEKYKPKCKVWYESSQFDPQDILCVEY